MSVSDGPRPSWIPGHARRHQRTGELDTRWMPACQCGWAFYASVRTLRIALPPAGRCTPPPPPF
jgi:hypothetical protein